MFDFHAVVWLPTEGAGALSPKQSLVVFSRQELCVKRDRGIAQQAAKGPAFVGPLLQQLPGERLTARVEDSHASS